MRRKKVPTSPVLKSQGGEPSGPRGSAPAFFAEGEKCNKKSSPGRGRLPVAAGPALPGWGGGSFRLGENILGWDIRNGVYWVHSFSCGGNDAAAAALVQAARKHCKACGFSKMFWQVFPESGGAMLKSLAKGRAKIDYIQMYLEV